MAAGPLLSPHHPPPLPGAHAPPPPPSSRPSPDAAAGFPRPQSPSQALDSLIHIPQLPPPPPPKLVFPVSSSVMCSMSNDVESLVIVAARLQREQRVAMAERDGAPLAATPATSSPLWRQAAMLVYSSALSASLSRTAPRRRPPPQTPGQG